jgi:hypothetical protein
LLVVAKAKNCTSQFSTIVASILKTVFRQVRITGLLEGELENIR